MNLWQNISIEGKTVRNEAPEKSAKKNNYGINSMYVSNVYT